VSTRAERLARGKENREEGDKLSCKKTDCNGGKHSYLDAPKRKHTRKALLEASGMPGAAAIDKPYAPGTCWACGDESIPWELTHARRPENINRVVELLQLELIRFEYWRKPFDELALEQARRFGTKRTKRRLISKFATATYRKPANYRDMQQTPWHGDVVCYAQHATGTCCRHCIERWHGVPMDQILTDEQVGYLTSLALRYLDIRANEIWGNEGTVL
jgi:hypothetical protein